MIALYIIFASINIICFIPREIPQNIVTDDEFSLFENSMILNYCRKGNTYVPKFDTKKLEEAETDEKISITEPAKSSPFMILGKGFGF